MTIDRRTTTGFAHAYPGMQFAAIAAQGVDYADFRTAAIQFASQVQLNLAQPSDRVQDNLNAFTNFFARYGVDSPLNRQIATAAKHGFPTGAPAPILALLALEAATGVLMGVQNLDAVKSYVQLDVTVSPESFLHLNGKTVTCSTGEIVVRDADGIIASHLRGPDSRTAVSQESRNLLFYVFDAHPSIGVVAHARACESVKSLLAPVSSTTSMLHHAPSS